MSIPRPNPGRKQGSSTARMSKTTSNSPSNLEKRDKDQHESQDTNPPIPTIHEESSPEKKFYKHFQNSPVKIIMAPTPHYFSPATQSHHGSLKPRQKPESTCQLWIDTAQH